MQGRVIRHVAATLGLAVCLAASPAAAQWSSWRGPTSDGNSPEVGLVSSWSPEGANLLWKADFTGRSTPVVVDGRVCVIGRTVGERIDRQEVVACFDVRDGRQLWEHRYNVYHTTVPYNRVGWASLAADPETGIVYAHGVAGQMTAYSPEGKILWSRFLAEEVGRYSGYGGRTQTPLVEGDYLIISFVNSGWGDQVPLRHRYFAFDKLSGDLVWVSTPGGMPKDFNTQSNAIAASLGGERVIVSGNADGWIYALRATTGEKLWSFHFSKRGLNSTVLVHDDKVYASHSEENVDKAVMGRVVAIDGTGRGDVTATHELWRIDELASGFPSPTYGGGTLYVLDNSANLYAINAADGSIRWEYEVGTVGKGSPVLADGKLYVTEVNGRIRILEPGAGGVKELDHDEVSMPDGRYAEIYASPAIADGRIYLSTETGLFCIGKKDAPQPTRIGSSGKKGKKKSPAPGKGVATTIAVVPADLVLQPGDSARFEFRAFDAAGKPVAAGKSQWTLDGIPGRVSTDGRLAVESGAAASVGAVKVKIGDAVGAARVRVIPATPWNLDFEDLEDGKSPTHWIGAAGKFVARTEEDGNTILVKAPRQRGLNRSSTYMGASDMSGYTIEADVRGLQEGRRRPDVGVINSGYIFDLLGAHQQVQVRSWSAELRMAQQADFTWEMGKWYRMKMRVDASKDGAVIRGKVWPRDEPEPEAWTIVAEDPHPILRGSPGLISYSPAEGHFDNVKVTVNQ